jgi:hypothetical protein
LKTQLGHLLPPGYENWQRLREALGKLTVQADTQKVVGIKTTITLIVL